MKIIEMDNELELPVVAGSKPQRRFEKYYRRGYGTEHVGPFLASLIRMVRPQRILEVGVGYTTPFITEAIEQNFQVDFDGNHDSEYYKKPYDPRYVIIDDMSLGQVEVPQREWVELINGKFQGMREWIEPKYGKFDFVWFDCGGPPEYEQFMKEYWDLCTEYVFFHFTYFKGQPNQNMDAILNNATGSAYRMDIVEPNKFRQGSITMLRKVNDI